MGKFFFLILADRVFSLSYFFDAFHTNNQNTEKLLNKDEDEPGYEMGHNFHSNH